VRADLQAARRGEDGGVQGGRDPVCVADVADGPDEDDAADGGLILVREAAARIRRRQERDGCMRT
jgi:hypothetical protein